MTTIINVSGTLEAAIETCVGHAPEKVATKDWRGIALHLMQLLDREGLVIVRRPVTPRERHRITGPVGKNEIVLALASGGVQAVVSSTGAPLDAMPVPMQRMFWNDLLKQALDDFEARHEDRR